MQRSLRSTNKNPVAYELPPLRKLAPATVVESCEGTFTPTTVNEDQHIKKCVAHLNQFGYFVVKGLNNINKEAIDKIKEGMLSSGQAHPIFESVTERLARGQKKLAKKNTFNDRLIQELGRHRVEDNGHCQVIDDVFQQNFKSIVALLKKISKASGRERGWDLGEVTYLPILSNERSTMQQIHLDFEGDWEQFDKIEQLYSLTPLSLLHFPEGGFLTVYPCESATKIPAKIPAPAGKNGCRREASWGRL